VEARRRTVRGGEVDATTERRVLGLVGLGLRARNAVVGVEQVRLAARRGKLALALVAPDASPNSLKKLLPLLGATKVRVIQGPGAAALGAAAGRESTAAIGIVDRALAMGLWKLVEETGAPSGAATRRGAQGAPAQ